jgi:dihydropteroate synthase
LLWRCRERAFDLGERTLVMGIVNVTPDSFSDGGRYLDPAAAIAHARRLMAEGAEVVDLGAESTRPGAEPVPAEEQLRRLLPVVEALAAEGACISVDTASAAVARQALSAGAAIVNEVTALGDPEMARVVTEAGAGIVLMHMRGTPRTMQHDPRYDDAAREVAEWLGTRLAGARRAGIEAERVALDPGIGFGKTARHNFELLARLEEMVALGRPVVVGVSRKSFLGKQGAAGAGAGASSSADMSAAGTSSSAGAGASGSASSSAMRERAALPDLPADQRLEGGLAATAVAVFLGARIVRTHDVAATVRAVRIADQLRAARRSGVETHGPV